MVCSSVPGSGAGAPSPLALRWPPPSATLLGPPPGEQGGEGCVWPGRLREAKHERAPGETAGAGDVGPAWRLARPRRALSAPGSGRPRRGHQALVPLRGGVSSEQSGTPRSGRGRRRQACVCVQAPPGPRLRVAELLGGAACERQPTYEAGITWRLWRRRRPPASTPRPPRRGRGARPPSPWSISTPRRGASGKEGSCAYGRVDLLRREGGRRRRRAASTRGPPTRSDVADRFPDGRFPFPRRCASTPTSPEMRKAPRRHRAAARGAGGHDGRGRARVLCPRRRLRRKERSRSRRKASAFSTRSAPGYGEPAFDVAFCPQPHLLLKSVWKPRTRGRLPCGLRRLPRGLRGAGETWGSRPEALRERGGFALPFPPALLPLAARGRGSRRVEEVSHRRR